MKQTLLIFLLCCWGGVLLKGQSISSVVPNQNPILEQTILSINISGTGTNFTAGSATTVTATLGNFVLYAQVDPNTLTSTNLDASFYIPCGVCGNVDVSVATPLDGQMTYANGFNVTCGQITTVSPNTGNPGQTLPVSISGTNLNFGQGSNSAWMYFYNPSTGAYLFPNGSTGGTLNSTNINLSIPSNNCGGSYDLVVYPNNNSCSVSLPNAFNVGNVGGQITMVNPDTIQPGQTLPIGISGTGVNFSQGSLTVYFQKAGTGQLFYPSTYNNITSNNVNVDFSAPSSMCPGNYDVCVQTAGACPTCLTDGLYVDGPANPQSITSVTTNPAPAQGGQPLAVTISGTGVDFSQGSSMSFVLTNSTTGTPVWSSFQIPNTSNSNQTTVYFSQMPFVCGSYDLQIYGTNNCSSNAISYPNAVTINSTLNPSLSSVVPYPSPSLGQLRLSLSGTDMNFMQGSTTLSVRLVSPTTGTVLIGSNINSNIFLNSIATVDFTAAATDCGYYNLEVSNVPTGCGGTTTVIYNRLVGVNIASCTNNAPLLSVLTVNSGNNNPVLPKVKGGAEEEVSEDDLQVLDQTNWEAGQISVQVFPNPMEQQTNILVEGEGQQVLNFALYDMLGQLIKQTQFSVNETLQLSRENLPAGMYVYRILDTTGNPLHTGKLEMK